METESQKFCLRWNNHQTNLISVFEELRQNEDFTDVTLAVESGQTIKCHKMILAASSLYFQKLFNNNSWEEHPIIVVLKDIRFKHIEAILQYMYRGEINVEQDELTELLKVAADLQVKGLNTFGDKKDSVNGVREATPHSYERSPPPATTPRSTVGNNGPISPPPSHENVYNFHGANQSQNQIPNPGLWPAISPFPYAQHTVPAYHSHLSALTRSYDQRLDSSPLRMKKKISSLMANLDTPILRTVLGQSHMETASVTSTAQVENNETRSRSNSSETERERRHSTDYSHNEDVLSPNTDMENDERRTQQRNANSFSASPREWKRYKQYTREDINAAIRAVKVDGVSALKASRIYNVPSRTLYDKVKKLGIKTQRHSRRNLRGSGNDDINGAQFPFIGCNSDGSIYRNTFSLGEKEYESMNVSQSSPGSVAQAHSEEDENLENMVEDLSIKSSRPVAPPLSPKEETMEAPEPPEN